MQIWAAAVVSSVSSKASAELMATSPSASLTSLTMVTDSSQLQSLFICISSLQGLKECVRYASSFQSSEWLWSIKIVVLPAAAFTADVVLTDVEPPATITILTPAEFSITIVVVVAYIRKECVVTLQQQGAQLFSAQALQLMLPQKSLVMLRGQLMGEAAAPPELSELTESAEEDVFTQVQTPARPQTVFHSAKSQAGPGHHLRLSVWTTRNKFLSVTNNLRQLRGISGKQIIH